MGGPGEVLFLAGGAQVIVDAGGPGNQLPRPLVYPLIGEDMVMAAHQQIQCAHQFVLETQIDHLMGIAVGAGAEDGVVGEAQA